MKTFLVLTAIVALVTGAAVAPAHAALVQLWTEASLNGGPFSTNPSVMLWPGIGGLEFHGRTGDFVDTGGTFSLGSFNVFGGFGKVGRDFTVDPMPFTINVTHCCDGSDTVDGTIAGQFGRTWSTLMVTFNDNVALIDGGLYNVLAMDDPLHFSPQSVDAVATPEPSTLLLVGTGLTSLAGAVRRKIPRGQSV